MFEGACLCGESRFTFLLAQRHPGTQSRMTFDNSMNDAITRPRKNPPFFAKPRSMDVAGGFSENQTAFDYNIHIFQ
jgi:hypothetical protein